MDLSIRHQIRHTKYDIKEFTEMANYFHIVYMAMKKCYYEGPLLNFEGGHGSRVLGARVPGPGSWSHFYTMPSDQIRQNIFFAYIIFIC